MAAVFIAAVIVAFTWLATVRWARFGDEPDGIAATGPRNALSAPLAAEQPAEDPSPPRTADGLSAPRWAHDEQEAA